MPLVFYWEKETLERLAMRVIGKPLKFRKYLVVDEGSNVFVYIYRWIIDGRCPFLSGNLCMIHNDKPISCKIFPLVVDVLGSRIYLTGRCNWVMNHRSDIVPERIPSIFEEFEMAVKVLAMVREFINFAKSKGWRILCYISESEVIDVCSKD